MAQSYHYQENFVHYLRYIKQEREDIISENVNVGEDYGIRRSLRRGTKVWNLNIRVLKPVVEVLTLCLIYEMV